MGIRVMAITDYLKELPHGTKRLMPENLQIKLHDPNSVNEEHTVKMFLTAYERLLDSIEKILKTNFSQVSDLTVGEAEEKASYTLSLLILDAYDIHKWLREEAQVLTIKLRFPYLDFWNIIAQGEDKCLAGSKKYIRAETRRKFRPLKKK